MSKRLENAMNLYLEGIRDGNYVEAINKYTGHRYTQHSTGVKDGKEGFIEFFGDFVDRCPVRDIQIIRSIVDERYVFLQAYQVINNGDAQWVTTDFFDYDDQDRIIEHWDVIAAYSDATPSGHTSIDGESEIKDFDKTTENKALVRNLLKDAFMRDGNPSKLDHYISKAQYIEHKSDVADGFENLAAQVQRENRLFNYEEIIHLLGQGNFVATLSRATCLEDGQSKEYAQVDIFRIENGLVVEHWDNVEPVPEVNVNSGKF